MHDVGNFILGILKQKNKSLRWLSGQCGVSNSYLSQLTRGLFRPTPDVLAKLAPHLGVTIERLFEETGWLNAQSVGDEPPQEPEGTLRTIELADDVYQALLKLVRSFEDTPSDVIRRLLALHKAGERDLQGGTAIKGQRDYETPVQEMISCLGLKKTRPPKITRVRGGTPLTQYELPILEVLVQSGGKATREQVLQDLRASMGHRLNTLDLEVLTDGRTPRWQRMTDWQKYRMVKDGFLRSDCPHGTWEITERGRERLQSLRNTQQC